MPNTDMLVYERIRHYRNGGELVHDSIDSHLVHDEVTKRRLKKEHPDIYDKLMSCRNSRGHIRISTLRHPYKIA